MVLVGTFWYIWKFLAHQLLHNYTFVSKVMVTVAKLYGSRPGFTSGPPLSATQWVRLSEMVTLWGLARYSAKFQSQSHVWQDVLFRVSKSYILFWESKSLCTTPLSFGKMSQDPVTKSLLLKVMFLARQDFGFKSHYLLKKNGVCMSNGCGCVPTFVVASAFAASTLSASASCNCVGARRPINNQQVYKDFMKRGWE